MLCLCLCFIFPLLCSPAQHNIQHEVLTAGALPTVFTCRHDGGTFKHIVIKRSEKKHSRSIYTCEICYCHLAVCANFWLIVSFCHTYTKCANTYHMLASKSISNICLFFNCNPTYCSITRQTISPFHSSFMIHIHQIVLPDIASSLLFPLFLQVTTVGKENQLSQLKKPQYWQKSFLLFYGNNC